MSAVVQQSLDKLIWFCTHQEKGGTKVVGFDALAKRFDALEKLLEVECKGKGKDKGNGKDESEVEPADLDDLRCFHWAVLPEWKEVIDVAEQLLRQRYAGEAKDAEQPKDGEPSSKKAKKTGAAASSASSSGPSKEESLRRAVLAGF